MLERDQRTNRLLSLLSDNDYERLRPHLSPVVLDYRKSLYEASRPMTLSNDGVWKPASAFVRLPTGSCTPLNSRRKCSGAE